MKNLLLAAVTSLTLAVSANAMSPVPPKVKFVVHKTLPLYNGQLRNAQVAIDVRKDYPGARPHITHRGTLNWPHCKYAQFKQLGYIYLTKYNCK